MPSLVVRAIFAVGFAYDAIPARGLPENGLLVSVFIDGHELDAQVDTGAGRR